MKNVPGGKARFAATESDAPDVYGEHERTECGGVALYRASFHPRLGNNRKRRVMGGKGMMRVRQSKKVTIGAG